MDENTHATRRITSDRLIGLLANISGQFDRMVKQNRSRTTIGPYDLADLRIDEDDINTAVGYLAEVGLKTDAARLRKRAGGLIHDAMAEAFANVAAEKTPDERKVYEELFGPLPSPADDDPIEQQEEQDRRLAISGRICMLHDHVRELLTTLQQTEDDFSKDVKHPDERPQNRTTLASDVAAALNPRETYPSEDVAANGSPPPDTEDSNIDDGTEIGTTHSKRDQRAEWVAKALVLRQRHPGWTKSIIASKVGVHPGQLSPKRCPELASLERLMQRSATSGHRDYDPETKTSTVDGAVSPSGTSDRGTPISGSRFCREYCDKCEAPIRVPEHQVGTKPLCEECAG